MLSAESELALARRFEAIGMLEHAIAAYWRSIELDASGLEPHERLAALYRDLRYADRAYWYVSKLARLKSYQAPSLFALAKANFQVGKLQAALHLHRQALRKVSSSPAAHSNYLFALLHDNSQTPSSLRRAHEDWFSANCSPTVPTRTFLNNPNSHRRLRVGYVSGEFRYSPASYFLLPILKQHDPVRFETFCYHLADTSDAGTEEYKKYAAHWRENVATSEALYTQIVDDGIDILVDLTGHISAHGLAVFQRRAAPVQIVYPNYPGTTGCREIDCLITDRWTTPDERSEKQYSEKSVYRLPSGYIVYSPRADSPDTTTLPALRKGAITFGLFQRPAKFNSEFWDAVAAILSRVSNSNIVVQHANRDLDELGSSFRSFVSTALAERGISSHRAQFVGMRNVREHLEIVSQCDIALDTFPYNGQTTTCSCLWMGVPVVTLAGERHASRVSYSLLSRLGLADWTATTLPQYVQIAAAKASDIRSLRALRASLRRRMADSVVCRPEIVVRQIEEAYCFLWRQWCAQTGINEQRRSHAASR